jgi:hypothetical protein
LTPAPVVNALYLCNDGEAELFFVQLDLVGELFNRGAQVTDLSEDTRQAARVMIALTVLFNNGFPVVIEEVGFDFAWEPAKV